MKLSDDEMGQVSRVCIGDVYNMQESFSSLLSGPEGPSQNAPYVT